MAKARRNFIGVLSLLVVFLILNGHSWASVTAYPQLMKFGSYGDESQDFKNPCGVAVDAASGEIYIFDTGNNKIKKYDRFGGFITEFGGEGSADGQFLFAQGVALDNSGNLYVADTGANRVQKFNIAGNNFTFISKFGLEGTGNGQFKLPRDIELDSNGNIYVCDSGNNRISKFGPSGNWITNIGGSTSLKGPYGFGLDKAGNIYVADTYNHRIVKFSANGTVLMSFGSLGKAAGQFSFPRDVLVDNEGNIFVADTENHRIQRFDKDGNYLNLFGVYTEFLTPQKIFLDNEHRMHVVDSNTNRIQVYDVTTYMKEVYVSPNPFSPDNDGVQDTTSIHYTIPEPAGITITIYDQDNNLVKTLMMGIQKLTDKNTDIWDGTDSSGVPVNPGMYTIKIDAVNLTNYHPPQEILFVSVIRPTGSISGLITDGAYPLEGVRVSDGTRSTLTDANGNYTLTNVPVGQLMITASKTGYSADRQSVSLNDGELRFNVDFVLDGAADPDIRVSPGSLDFIGLIGSSWTSGITTLIGTSSIPVVQPQVTISVEDLSKALDYEIKLKARRFVPARREARGQKDITAKAKKLNKDKLHVLLQLEKTPTDAEKKSLKAAGIELLSYVPNHAWFATVPSSKASQLSTVPLVRWAGVISAQDKISPRILESGVPPHAVNQDGTVTVRVQFFNDVLPAAVNQIMALHGGHGVKASKMLNVVTVSLPQNSINSLADEDAVQWIEEVSPKPVEHNDGVRGDTGVDTVQSAPYGLTGTNVTIGIWDGGHVDATHDDFGSRVVYGDAAEVTAHATHVAGTVGGAGSLSASLGGSSNQWKGMAPNAKIVSYEWSDAATEHEPAIQNYWIDISQNSWGYAVESDNCDFFGDYTFTESEYDSIVQGGFGKPLNIVFSAGNERTRTDCNIPAREGYSTIVSPATGKNVITVGAVNSDNNAMTAFSSWGPVDDGRIKPDLVAPGCEAGGEGYVHSTMPGDIYGGIGWCGTSMAAPTVSGIAALMIEQFRGSFGADPLPSTIKAIIVHTARDLENPGPDYKTGFGLIDAKGAVDIIRDKAIVEGAITSTGEINTYSIDIPEGSAELKITLGWDDAPGEPNSATELINDLDMVLVSPQGTEYFPWKLDPANPSAPATTGADHVNNIEQIFIANPAAGTWSLRVAGTAIPQPAQRYSLISNRIGFAELRFSSQKFATIYNEGGGQLVVSSITSNQSWLSVDKSSTTLASGTSAGLKVAVNGTNMVAGTYYGQIEISSNDPNESLMVIPVTFIMDTPPSANLNGPCTGIEGEPITMDASGSSDSDGIVALYQWDVNNDGQYEHTTTTPIINHSYAQNGTYTVRLKVSDEQGASAETTTTAIITDTAPTADFTGTPTTDVLPLTVTFNNLSVGNDEPLTYEWDFNNDRIIDSTDRNPSYVYKRPGTHSVKLKVTDADGSTHELVRSDYISVAIPEFLTITAMAGPGGSISPPGGTRVDYESRQSFELTPVEGYHIAGVQSDCGGSLTGNIYTTEPILANCIVTASFSNIYMLTVTKSGKGADIGTITSSSAGIDCGADCTEAYIYGTEVILNAIENSNSLLSGWSGACDGNATTCKVTMDSDKTVTASFGVSTWAKSYGGSDSDEARVIQQTSDGGYIMAGKTKSFGAGGFDAWIVKLDRAGTVEWQKAYGGDKDDEANQIREASNGEFIIAGKTYSYGVGSNPNGWMLRLYKDGNVKWQQTYGGACGGNVNAFQELPNGDFVVAGTHCEESNVLKNKLWVFRINEGGTIVWQKIYSGHVYVSGYNIHYWTSAEPAAIQVTADGGYILGGNAVIEVYGGGYNGYKLIESFMLRLNSDGSIRWSKTYRLNNGFLSVQQTTDGGYIVGGSQNYIYKLYPDDGVNDGKIQWQKYITNSGGVSLASIQQSSNGEYVASGRLYSSGIWVPLLVKFDVNGIVKIKKMYSIEGVINSLYQTFNGAYIATSVPYNVTDSNQIDAWVLKADSNGNIPGDCIVAKDASVSVPSLSQTVDEDNRKIDTWSDSAVAPQLTSVSPFDTTVVPSDYCRPRMSTSSASLNFGSVNIGSSASKSVTVKNAGTLPLVTRIDIAGSNVDEFMQTNDCSTVESGSSCTINVSFISLYAGIKNATLSISSNDPDNPLLSVPLSAVGGWLLTVTKQGGAAGTVTSSPVGINCGADCDEAYYQGTQVTLTAVPDDTSRMFFAGWSGGTCTGTQPCTIMLNADTTVTAAFNIKPQDTLSVQKAGTGSGKVISSPSGIECGADCSESYYRDTVVTLTASPVLAPPDSASEFAGWSGGGCGETVECEITINAAETVTATFNILPPVADFTGSPTNGNISLVVNFADQSLRPYTWLWDFGDNFTSTAQNPSHIYKATGTYTVSLKVSNPSGSDTKTITNYVTIEPCSNLPVRIAHQTPIYFSTLQAAYDAAVEGDAIQSLAVDFFENINVNRDISVTLSGGYDCGYAAQIGSTTLEGTITTTAGTLTIGDFEIVSEDVDNIYSLIASADIGGSISPQGTVTVNSGAGQTFTITPEPGYTITKVLVDDLSVGPVTSYTLDNIQTNHRIEAIFTNKLVVTKTGTATGTVTSASGRINCGTDCEEKYIAGTPETLMATLDPDGDSIFAGWSGACSGVGICSLTMDEDKSVTATFNITPPIADFTASPTNPGVIPFVPVVFTDRSLRAQHWTWDFGDGTTSTESNPTHTYTTVGTYAVTLTVTNTTASDVETKVGYINVQAVPNLPVKVSGLATSYHSTLQGAYDAASNGDTIQTLAIEYTESLNANRDIELTLAGGYSGDYTTRIGVTTLKGQITTSAGRVTIKDFVIANSTTGSSYAIASQADIGGSISPAGTVVVAAEANETFTITPDPGYTITKVLVDGVSVGAVATYTLSNITANHRIEAIFTNKLAIAKTGTATGTVTSSSGRINCGSDCDEKYISGAAVTLTATPDPGAVFSGWSWGGCTSFGDCTINMNADVTVTATFDIAPPEADFTATPTNPGVIPFIPVVFTDRSMRAQSWLWNFGDGTTSTDQNPTHTYTTVGSYTVSLTVTNTTGSSTKTISNYIVVQPASLPVKVSGSSTSYYSTLQGAYAAAETGDIIQTLAVDYIDNLNADRDIEITLSGGYNGDYTARIGVTTLKGQITTTAGRVIIRDFVLVNSATADSCAIAARADIGGSISPFGTIIAAAGSNETFTISPEPGYSVVNVFIDGVSVGPVTSYTFSNIATNHRIEATFTNVLAVIKSGTSTGRVTTTPAGIDCGADCSNKFAAGTVITLAAVPDDGVVFTGWSGGGCTGTGDCVLTVNADTTITAGFDLLNPTAGFNCVPTSGIEIVTTICTDLSGNNPTSWLWDLGDGTTSTERNLVHTYAALGIYPVSLTVSNAGGSNTITKPNYITVLQCPNLPVRIIGTSGTTYYISLQSAYDAAVDGDVIQSRNLIFTENLTTNRDVSVTLAGGYDCGYTGVAGVTIVRGSMTIDAGLVTVQDFDIQQ